MLEKEPCVDALLNPCSNLGDSALIAKCSREKVPSPRGLKVRSTTGPPAGSIRCGFWRYCSEISCGACGPYPTRNGLKQPDAKGPRTVFSEHAGRNASERQMRRSAYGVLGYD